MEIFETYCHQKSLSMGNPKSSPGFFQNIQLLHYWDSKGYFSQIFNKINLG